MTWLLDHASNAIRYRAITDVARLSGEIARSERAGVCVPPALTLAVAQSPDGIWNGSMLEVPSSRAEHFERVGTISAFRRLLEYGWNKDAPPLLRTRRVLFRLLAEDDDPAYLFELAPRDDEDGNIAHRGRSILREAAASALAQAGYEGDPRLRGAASRVLDRIDSFLRSPLSHKPWVRVGNNRCWQQRPPSFDLRPGDASAHAALPERASRGARSSPPLRVAGSATTGGATTLRIEDRVAASSRARGPSA